MKILYCIPNLRYGGAERQLSYVAGDLASIGHEIHIASSRGGANLERLKSSTVEWHRLGGYSNYDPIIFFRLIVLIKKLKPDVVQTILTPMDLMGGLAALLTRTPWVLRESSSSLLYKPSLRNKLRTFLGKLANSIVSNSNGGDLYWSSVGARSRHIIPNTIPFEEIARLNPTEFDQVPFLFAESKIVLFVGRLDAGKNAETFITAVAKIADEIPFIALICGDGPLRRKHEEIVKDLELEERIIFLGNASNVWSLMKRADAFVSLSRFEGCPNVVLEAAACGSPLVISNISAHRELLDESCALFVDPEDYNGAACAIKKTLLSGEESVERAKVARVKIGEMAAAVPARSYEKVYMNVIKN
jgi:glycosyltransferase involved in cell wall biosynthesis